MIRNNDDTALCGDIFSLPMGAAVGEIKIFKNAVDKIYAFNAFVIPQEFIYFLLAGELS